VQRDLVTFEALCYKFCCSSHIQHYNNWNEVGLKRFKCHYDPWNHVLCLFTGKDHSYDSIWMLPYNFHSLHKSNVQNPKQSLAFGNPDVYLLIIIEWLGARLTEVTSSGEKWFFCSKAPKFLRVVLNWVEEHSPVHFFSWFALCLRKKKRNIPTTVTSKQ